MIDPFGKAGLTLVAVAAVSMLALALAARPSTPRPYRVWVFDPVSVRTYERLGDVDVEQVPARLLAVRAMAAAIAKAPCAADVIEIEQGSTRRSLALLPDDVAALARANLPDARIQLWQEDAAQGARALTDPGLRAIPRDINPVVLVYRPDLWMSAGISLESVKSWDDLLAAAGAYRARTGVAALELPSGNASVVLLLLQQRGVILHRGLFQPKVAGALLEYRNWLSRRVSGEPARRLELTADAFAEGKIAALIAAEWRVTQLRGLLPARTPIEVRALPNGEAEKGQATAGRATPTLGGTGAGLPLHNTDRARGLALLRRLVKETQRENERFDRPPWAGMVQAVGPAPITGEPTAAVQRELNGALRAAIAAEPADAPQVIENALRAADGRLRSAFPEWGGP